MKLTTLLTTIIIPASWSFQLQDSDAILENQRKMINNPDFSDVLLIARDSRSIHCHSGFLMAQSPFFKAALSQHKEWYSEPKITRMQFDLPYETLLSLVTYTYTGVIKDPIDAENAWEMAVG